IAYVTKTGTTQGIAEEIGRVAAEHGIVADVLPLSAVASPEGYGAVVIGAPINGMQWVPEAGAFVEKHRDALLKVPTAYFFVSYLMNVGAPLWQKTIRKSLDKVSALVPPVKTAGFPGRVDKAFPGFARLLFGLKKGIPIDLVDLEAVREWAEEYVREMVDGRQ
ncbi:MAG: flavodoxin domain-containing protein, partial [Candidatus Marinimicrobia bacterium]|nr:flavodoxin domain-containing protein [Candidatus Neomarinimicrobiota bacterium]